MRVVHTLCCGLDVHKRTLTACLLHYHASGGPDAETRTFPTTTAGLLELADWLTSRGCAVVALESTGVYWKPVFNILEGSCETILLVNAQHIKQVPGRKTDVKDARWIAELLAHGLLRGSLIPPAEIRDLRDLTRYRTKLVKQRADQSNRIQKLLETCNIKLASVASDVLGASGWLMLEALAAGATDPEQLADLARGKLRNKIPQLKQALHGRMSDVQRWLLAEQLEHVAQLEARIAKLNEKIEELCLPFEPLLSKLMEIPGVSRRIAEIIVAEIGIDMSRFPSAQHLSSWAGMCPGNHESGGRQKSGKRRPGSTWLRAALTEAGWAASRSKDNYLAAQYQNIRRRRGAKRACVAVGHSILTIAYHLLSAEDAHYKDLGPDHFQTKDKQRLATQLLRRLGKLGFTVTIETTAA
jgi:transposase